MPPYFTLPFPFHRYDFKMFLATKFRQIIRGTIKLMVVNSIRTDKHNLSMISLLDFSKVLN